MIFTTHRLWVVHASAAIQIYTEIVTFVVHDEKSILLHFNDVANGQDQDDARNSIGFSSKSYRMQSQGFALPWMQPKANDAIIIEREKERKRKNTFYCSYSIFTMHENPPIFTHFSFISPKNNNNKTAKWRAKFAKRIADIQRCHTKI